MKSGKEKYINFPIQLLDGFMIDSKRVLTNILNYGIHDRYEFLNIHTLESNGFNNEEEILFEKTASYLLVNPNYVEQGYNKGKVISNQFSGNTPMTGINISMFWEFYDNDKSDFEKICLLGFLAIKSIIGNKPYCKATDKYLWARMDGKAKAVNNVMELSDEVRKFTKEYQTKKIKNALRDGWGLVYYARYTRGFYVSFKITPKQLILEAETRRISTKEKQYKMREKEMIKEVVEQLKVARPYSDL